MRPFPHQSPMFQVADFYSAPVAGFRSAVDTGGYVGYRFPAEVISHAVWLYLWTVPA
jgi:hypothetical protein